MDKDTVKLNSKLRHKIQIGTLVEIVLPNTDFHKMRLYVIEHDRRTYDRYPTYILGPKGYNLKIKFFGFFSIRRMLYANFTEQQLRIVEDTPVYTILERCPECSATMSFDGLYYQCTQCHYIE